MANAECNNPFFEEEMEKLENWAVDVTAGIEKEFQALDAEIKFRKSESKKTSHLEEKVRLQRLTMTLKSDVAKRVSIFIRRRAM